MISFKHLHRLNMNLNCSRNLKRKGQMNKAHHDCVQVFSSIYCQTSIGLQDSKKIIIGKILRWLCLEILLNGTPHLYKAKGSENR
jgi:hypothetical protein